MMKSAFGAGVSTGSAIAPDLQGLVAGTVVMTAEGALPVEYLVPGDRIVTRSGLRRLRGVTVRRLRRAAMVRIGTDTLGVGRPAAEVLVPEGQLVVIRDWRARAMFATSQALVPAGRLVDGRMIRSETGADLRLFRLHFDGAEIVQAGGLELACAAQVADA